MTCSPCLSSAPTGHTAGLAQDRDLTARAGLDRLQVERSRRALDALSPQVEKA